MSKKEKDKEQKEEVHEQHEQQKKLSNTLPYLHKCLTQGRILKKRYENWSGTIKINKAASISIADEKGKRMKVTIPGGKPVKVGLAVLSRLVMRSIQEGPEEKRNDWKAKGRGRAERPLEIEIIEESIDVNSPLAYKKALIEGGSVPTLDD